MKKLAIVTLLIMILGVATACGNSKPNQFSIPVEPFEYMNQDEETVSLSDLSGKVWVADFVFTHCITVCPTMTANMAELQKRLKKEGVEAELISFSVDPERDDPAALKSYLEKFDADFTNWHALTGYEYEDIKSFVLKSFKTPLIMDTASDQVIHGTSFYLVDQSGTVVAKYDGTTDTPYDKIIKDVKALQK
ncbi:protein SCO1/2 [Paenibacillus uliginis N3/975]|uniref:Protein SCO1/2 n=1 Tax=Paenibacillus uliginis N3/975 TaxID=1313296 RepID=A0A1X7HBT0_9BACL|nr:SCO family protein [Paenibacillus uliginis]SMF83540.1 protein SCO1/2 [Paenibacillus uliginis N3/975]